MDRSAIPVSAERFARGANQGQLTEAIWKTTSNICVREEGVSFMRLFRRFAVLGALVLISFGLWRGRAIQAQGGCTATDPNLFAGTCGGTKSDCLYSATASRNSCYGKCDKTYCFGTP